MGGGGSEADVFWDIKSVRSALKWWRGGDTAAPPSAGGRGLKPLPPWVVGSSLPARAVLTRVREAAATDLCRGWVHSAVLYLKVKQENNSRFSST